MCAFGSNFFEYGHDLKWKPEDSGNVHECLDNEGRKSETVRCQNIQSQSVLQMMSAEWGPCAYVIVYGNLPPSQSFCGYRWVASQNGFH